MPDTYVALPNGSYVQVPDGATPDQLTKLRTKLSSYSKSAEVSGLGQRNLKEVTGEEFAAARQKASGSVMRAKTPADKPAAKQPDWSKVPMNDATRSVSFDPADPLGYAHYAAGKQAEQPDFLNQAVGTAKGFLASSVDPRMLVLEVLLGGAPALLRSTQAVGLAAPKALQVVRGGAKIAQKAANVTAGTYFGAQGLNQAAEDVKNKRYGAATVNALGSVAALTGAGHELLRTPKSRLTKPGAGIPALVQEPVAARSSPEPVPVTTASTETQAPSPIKRTTKAKSVAPTPEEMRASLGTTKAKPAATVTAPTSTPVSPKPGDVFTTDKGTKYIYRGRTTDGHILETESGKTTKPIDDATLTQFISEAVSAPNANIVQITAEPVQSATGTRYPYNLPEGTHRFRVEDDPTKKGGKVLVPLDEQGKPKQITTAQGGKIDKIGVSDAMIARDFKPSVTVEAPAPAKHPTKAAPAVVEPLPAPETPAQAVKPAGEAPGVPERDITGVAKAVTKRDHQKGVSVDEMRQIGRTAYENGVDPIRIATETMQTGKPMTDEHIAAAGHKLRLLRNEKNDLLTQIDKVSDPAAIADINRHIEQIEGEANHLLDATDLSLNKGFHRMGMAAQVVLDKDFMLADLPRRAKAANMGQDLDAIQKTKVQEYEKANATLKEQLVEAKNALEEALKKPAPKLTRQGLTSAERDLKRVRQYFGMEEGVPASSEAKMGRTSGAVRYTLPKPEMEAMAAMRRLAREVAQKNPDFTLDQVVGELRKQTGISAPDEQFYRMLSEPYRKSMIEADVNRLKATRYLNEVKRSAEFKLRSPAKRAFSLVGQVLNTTQRGMQAGLDLSAPFIQGRKGITANAAGWARAWAPMLKAAAKGQNVALESIANIERDPMYSRSKAAGLDITEPGQKFSSQEEMFAGNLVEYMAEHGGKLNPFRIYAKGLQHSEAAYTVFLNELRWDTFKKLAAADPNNPAHLRDSASTVNTIFGRGASKLAKAVGGQPLAGNLLYAPRYNISQWEFAMGRPILRAETATGRTQAMKIYAGQAAMYGTLVGLARLAGMKVDTDPRSTDFGRVEIPGGSKVDLFAKEGQAWRLMTQIMHGKIAQGGKYTGTHSVRDAAHLVGEYGANKMAPGPRLAAESFLGKLDKKEGKFTNRPIGWKDLLMDYTPLWIQSGIQDGTFEKMPLLGVAQFFGEDVQMGKLSNTKVPLKPLKPGIFGKSAPKGAYEKQINTILKSGG